MTCYFRHLKSIFEEAGITITKENRKRVDEVIHSFVGVDYKNCSETWKQVKMIINDDEQRVAFVSELRDASDNL